MARRCPWFDTCTAVSSCKTVFLCLLLTAGLVRPAAFTHTAELTAGAAEGSEDFNATAMLVPLPAVQDPLGESPAGHSPGESFFTHLVSHSVMVDWTLEESIGHLSQLDI